MITVFTATYNRSDLLSYLYESLKIQTCLDFEWVVVDDGSTDATPDFMKKISAGQTPFPVYYYVQKHGGKHRAINLGVKKAEGDWFFIVDSDDFLLPDAIERVSDWIENVDNNDEIAGVAGLCVFSNGQVVGETPDLPRGSYVDASNVERYKMSLLGDKAEVYRTNVLAMHPFPEIEGESFVTERYCWDAIAADGYKLRWFNEPIYCCEYLDSGLTKSGANSLKGHVDNFGGYCLYVRQSLGLWAPSEAVTLLREYNNVASFKGLSLLERASAIGWSKMRYLLALGAVPSLYAIRLSGRWLRKR